MTYYPDFGFSDCQVAGAVAEAAIHDLRINHFIFSGFPQIDVSSDPGSFFTVVLCWKQTASTRFQLSEAEAKSAAKKFRSRAGYGPAIFNKVQDALADLENKVSRYPTVSIGSY